MFKVNYSHSANAEIVDILRYIKQFSAERALSYVKGLDERIQELIKDPYIGRPAQEEYDIPNSRIIYFKSHKIIYCVSEQTETINIEVIIHNKKDHKSY